MTSPDFSQYIDLTSLDVDPSAIYLGAVELGRLTLPEFTLRQGTPEDAIFQALSFVTGITTGAINRLPDRLMVGMGSLLGYNRYMGSRATVSATITLASYSAETIPSGTIFSWAYEDEDGELIQYAFELVDNLDIAAGTPPTLPSGVGNLRSVIAGNLPTLPVGTSLSIITTNTSISTAVTTNSFVNGVDPESDNDYLNSLTTYIRSLSSTIATSNQLQASILTSFREVARCKVYDLTDPSGTLLVGAADAPGYATVFVYGRNRTMTSSEKADISTFIDDRLTAGVTHDVLDFEIAGVGISVAAAYDSTYVDTEVEAAIEAVLDTYISPGHFPAHENSIKMNNVLARISRVEGILYVTSVAMRPIGNLFTQKQWLDVRLATAVALPTCTYANGTSGVGATLTASSNGALSVDSTSVIVGDRILVKDQATGLQNGIYTVSNAGSAGSAWVLTRTTDADASGDFAENKRIYITSGSTLGGATWRQSTSASITLGTTSIAFAASTPYTDLDFAKKGTLPDISLGNKYITLTGVTI